MTRNYQFITHGMSKRPVYRVWQSMKDRCLNPRHCRYADYGGRGIKVCDRWLRFENFLADMGEPPKARMTLDRENNDGNYEPGNCRWATYLQQGGNTRSNHWVTARGETHTLFEWARLRGLKHELIRWRLKHGWTPEPAIFTPVDKIHGGHLNRQLKAA